MTMNTLHRPTHHDALVHLEAAFERGDMMAIFGRCTVDYNGHATSELDPGDRLVVLKPGGSILAHVDEKRMPVNWQPPDYTHSASVRDGRLRVKGTRTSPNEHLDVQFERVERCSAYVVNDWSDLELVGNEGDLRQHILSDPDIPEPGFGSLEAEQQNDAGAIDVFSEDVTGVPVVVKLKRRHVGPSTTNQLRRYVDVLHREFGDNELIRDVLVAPSVTERMGDVLDRERLEFIALDPETGEPPIEGGEGEVEESEEADGADAGT